MERNNGKFRSNKFMNNDLAVGAKGRIPSGEFYEKKI
jgi:penicillin-binding protein 2